MIDEFDLTPIQMDALREIGNVGAGNSATALSQIINKRIDMNVPKVALVPIETVPDLVGGPDTIVVGVFLRVYGKAPGNILFLMPKKSAFYLVDITRVPFSANYIKGVINLRGSVLPVIDLKKRLGLEQTPYTDKTRIVTVKVGDLPVGMLVDAVTEVLTITTKLVEAKKAISEKDIGKFVSGIGNMDGRLIIMLNLEEIVGIPG